VLHEASRSGNDSATIKFFFLNSTSFPATGTIEKLYKVVDEPQTPDEVRIFVDQVHLTNTIGYNCIGSDNIKATITVNFNGKISIKLPKVTAKRVLETETIQVSADIHEQ